MFKKAYAIFWALITAFVIWWCFGGAHAVFVTGFTFEQSFRDIYFMGGGAVAMWVYFLSLKD